MVLVAKADYLVPQRRKIGGRSRGFLGGRRRWLAFVRLTAGSNFYRRGICGI
jgi:hypothetical protein